MRPDMNIQMGEFVVMPNHFHAIIIIIGKMNITNVMMMYVVVVPPVVMVTTMNAMTVVMNVETQCIASLQQR